MAFPCSGCGLCCQQVRNSPETQHLDRGDGTCAHYDATRQGCTIYETRPMVCRIDASYPRFAARMTLPEYHAANADVCNALQRAHGAPGTYRINLSKD